MPLKIIYKTLLIPSRVAGNDSITGRHQERVSFASVDDAIVKTQID